MGSSSINRFKVNKKFKIGMQTKHIFFCYREKFLPRKKLFKNGPLVPDEKIYYQPEYLFCNSSLIFLRDDLAKNIETFIFYGNGNFKVPYSFNFSIFPKLKYLEVMDTSFCNTIRENFKNYLEEKKKNSRTVWNYFSPNIETLIMVTIDFSMLLTSFVNAKHIVIQELTNKFKSTQFSIIPKTKWKTFVFKNDKIKYQKDKEQNFIINFLIKYCPKLNSVGLFINHIEQLDKLLNCHKLKHICVNTHKDKFIVPYKDYKKIFTRHEVHLKDDCVLYINGSPIKNFNDFLSFMIVSKHCRKIIKSNEKYFRYVSLVDNPNFPFCFKKIFPILPKTIEYLKISSYEKIDQDVFNSIPQYFPYLRELILDFPFSVIDDFTFIENLKHLTKLNSSSENVGFREFFEVLEMLDFISQIFISESEFDVEYFWEFSEILFLLTSFYEKKKKSVEILRVNCQKLSFLFSNKKTI